MNTNQVETIVLGGGCFWCVEAVFQKVPGVKSIVSGYSGGKTPNPTYEQVCSGTTGHAEVVQVGYDQAVLSLERLLVHFWDAHDPTTLNRQGADVGTQYRSVIYYNNDQQKAVVEKSKTEAQSRFRDPIVTQIAPLEKFYRAEDYHQNYYNNNPDKGYSRAVIKPKVDKVEKTLKATPQPK
ncbi:MAG TPA: peptide-methionine (S)-S-oxide reductase MsrA [Verrucomicrobiae bacterium]|nr:peptide-methionine (S)-S-oxide reductase MsrA [Verrucomicrobiae bacterium]